MAPKGTRSVHRRYNKSKKPKKSDMEGRNVEEQTFKDLQESSNIAAAMTAQDVPADTSPPSSLLHPLVIDRTALTRLTSALPSKPIRQQKADERQTLHNFGKTSINDTHNSGRENTHRQSNDEPSSSTITPNPPSKVDLATIRCIISIRTGNSPYLEPIPYVASLGTRLGRITNYVKLYELIEDCYEMSHPLKEIYNLDLGQHKEALISFTDHLGDRHTMPLYRYTDARMNTVTDPNGHGPIITEWKRQVEHGELSDAPRCYGSICACHGRFHGVEVIQVLKTDSLVAKCVEFHQGKWQMEDGGLKARVGELEGEVEMLRLKLAAVAVGAAGAESEDGDDGDEEEEINEDDVSEYEE